MREAITKTDVRKIIETIIGEAAIGKDGYGEEAARAARYGIGAATEIMRRVDAL